VVVVTDHAFVDIYSWLARQMANAYFDQGVVGIAAGERPSLCSLSLAGYKELTVWNFLCLAVFS
jgi:hypothetical protein